MRLRAAWLLVLLTATAVAAAPALRAELRKADDAATVTEADGTVIVTITSASGIGGATLTRGDQAWPARLVVRLRLRMLEHVAVKAGAVALEGSLAHPGEFRIIQREGDIEVILPARLLTQDHAHLELTWIDAYR
jgi:hypothetical protein